MKLLIDNNLPVSLAIRLRKTAAGHDVQHIYDLGLQAHSDTQLMARWHHDNIIWVSRDEDFWLTAPANWAIVWVACHNPRLSFLRDTVAPLIAANLTRLTPGARLVITEGMATFM